MRILLCGVAAVALSGCSWMGFGNSQSSHTYGNNTYSQKANNNGCCVGGKTLSRWNIESGLGADFATGGNAITGNQAPIGFLNPTTTLQDVSNSDAYAVGYRAELGGSYAVNPNRKVSLTGHYAQADGNEVTWGTQDTATLRGTMSDYKSYGLEAGIRQYATPARIPLLKSVRPYVEAKLGAAHIDAIRLENINEVGGLVNPGTPTSLAMYESSWVPTAAGLIGIETPIFNRFTMGVETGIRYAGVPKSDNSDKAAGTFNARYNGANNGGTRWSVPLTIRGRYRF
ncbi:MAG: hypothetical protein L3J65_07325 [Robiginitomaculum sp.]|nr:hypothetical protein [Robiginitomaculum sp.]